MKPRELLPGSTFGRYTIVRPIGAGGMAAVYEARHVDLHKPVALKVLHAHLALRIEVVQRFVLEARAASRLSHPHVVGMSDIGSHGGVPFIAMDLLRGEPLAAVLAREGPLPLARIADVMLPVLSAVVAAHEAGVLHRDLKSDNVFLAQKKHGVSPVLLDFGISKLDSGGPPRPLTVAGDLLGTPPYMSPEQVREGMARFDARSDQYALGVLLHECATGKLPYRDHASVDALLAAVVRGGAPPPSSLRPDLPPAFDALVLRAMSLVPSERFASVLELGRALLPFASARARAVWSDEFEAHEAPGAARAMAEVDLGHRELAALPLFDDVPHEDLGRLVQATRARRLGPGAPLFDQGSPASSLFVIVDGELELTRTHGADTWSVGIVARGALVGLPALWDGGPRPVSAAARAEVVALEIARSELDTLASSCPSVVDRLYEAAATVVGQRLAAADERARDLLGRPDPEADADRDVLVRFAAALGEWSLALPPAQASRRRD